MFVSRRLRLISSFLSLGAVLALAGCGHSPRRMSDFECMQRVMYFESNRSSPDGMLAVGTVVMNRVKSKDFPNSVCAVVGQKKQFAPGVLSKPMTDSGKPLAAKMAKKVLRGARHPGVGKARFFHTAGYNFPYTNMHYVVLAGGNSFYEKRKALPGRPNRPQAEVILAAKFNKPVRPVREERPTLPEVRPERPIMVASAQSVVAPRMPVPSQSTLFAPAGGPTMAPDAPAPRAPASIEELIAFN